MKIEKSDSKICKGYSEVTGKWMALGAGIGITLGAGIGTAFDKTAIGVGTGVAIGAAVGMLLMQSKMKKDEDS